MCVIGQVWWWSGLFSQEVEQFGRTAIIFPLPKTRKLYPKHIIERLLKKGIAFLMSTAAALRQICREKDEGVAGHPIPTLFRIHYVYFFWPDIMVRPDEMERKFKKGSFQDLEDLISSISIQKYKYFNTINLNKYNTTCNSFNVTSISYQPSFL